MSLSNAVPTQDVPEYSLVTLVKRTPNWSGEPHVVPVADVDTIEVPYCFFQRNAAH